MSILQATNLKKSFGSFQAVNGVSFSVEKGEVFGVLGPNGAGKSTTINMLATMLLPTSGTAVIDGLDVVKNATAVREKIGLCTASSRFIWELNAYEILNYYGMLYGLDSGKRKGKVEDLIEFFGISEFKDKEFGQLSTGMRQKIALAKSLVNDPVVWFLDEPTNGLDIEISKEMRDKVGQIVKERQTTVILTSHYLSEVEEMCDRIALINEGKVIAIGGINEIKQSLNFFDTITFNVENQANVSFLENINGVELFRQRGKAVMLRAKSPQHVLAKMLDELEKHGEKIHGLEVKRPTLEEVFLKLVKTARKDKK